MYNKLNTYKKHASSEELAVKVSKKIITPNLKFKACFKQLFPNSISSKFICFCKYSQYFEKSPKIHKYIYTK